MSDVLPPQRHALSHAPAALRIFRFAADSAPRVLEITHVSAFLRECAVEFGSADATVPGAMRCEHVRWRYFRVRIIVNRFGFRCPWLAEKLLMCRSGAPVPPAALAPDVTRHDVNWGAEGARRNDVLQLSHDGFGLLCVHRPYRWCWAQGPVGVTSGKHFFQVSITAPDRGYVMVGFVDDKISILGSDNVGWPCTEASGAAFSMRGRLMFGTAPLVLESSGIAAPEIARPCAIGCFLDLDATPARMTVFVDGEPLAVQCEYDFPKDGRAWFPSVSLHGEDMALHSCEV